MSMDRVLLFFRPTASRSGFRGVAEKGVLEVQEARTHARVEHLAADLGDEAADEILVDLELDDDLFLHRIAERGLDLLLERRIERRRRGDDGADAAAELVGDRF